MSWDHKGNIQPFLDLEEHDGDNMAKRVNVVAGGVGQATVNVQNLASAATLYAVVNTTAAGQSSIVIDRGHQYIGLVTNTPVGLHTVISAGNQTVTHAGLMTLAASPAFIGLVTANISNAVGNATLNPSPNFIGLTTTTLGASPAFIGIVTVTNPSAFSGNVTLDDGSLTGIVGNVTLSDAKTFIGLTTTTLGASPAFIGIVTVANPSAFTGNVTLDDGSLTGIVGNVTLSDAKTYIGLTTATVGAGTAGIGFATVNVAAIAAGDNNIGNFDLASAIPAGSNNIGDVDILSIANNNNYIGLVTVTAGRGHEYIGLVTNTPVGLSTVIQGTSPWSSSIVGNVTLSDAKTFIGLVTNVPALSSDATVHTQVLSTGATIFVPAGGQRFFLKSIHIASLGRAEVEVRSGATAIIPMTALATTSGFYEHYGDNGLPARAADNSLNIVLNAAAANTTITVATLSRFV